MPVICNPRSGRVRRRLGTVRRLARELGGELYREAVGPAEVAGALGELDGHGSDTLCVVGGDGTVQAVLTALAVRRPDRRWPRLALAPGGTANMTAKDLGADASPIRSLRSLLHWRDGDAGGARVVHRPVLGVDRPSEDPLYGMFFGLGAVASGVRFFRRRLEGLGVVGERISAVALLRVLLRLALGGREELSAGPVECAVDGRPSTTRPTLLCLVSALERLLLRTRPYWGDGGEPLHFTLLETGARNLWWNLPRVARGRPGEALTAERGYVSHDVRTVDLRFDGFFVLDGELYEARSASGPVRITAARTAEWLVA